MIYMMEEGLEKVKTIQELSDKELRQAYVVADECYRKAYKEKKEIEEEMVKRFKSELQIGK